MAHRGNKLPARGRGLAAFRFVKRLRRDEDGATAIEFAFVATPFFALLFAIIETALVFWTSQVMETAVSDASRLIYTGQFQRAHGGKNPAELQAAFRTEICSRVVALFDCEGKLQVDVRSYSNFGDVGFSSMIDGDGAFASDSFTFENSQERAIVVVRAAVEYPVFVTLLDASRANLANGKRLIAASAAFRNEPFGQVEASVQ